MPSDSSRSYTDSEQPSNKSSDDDDFSFNAPSYYDLKHPELEQQYVNDADGYFSTSFSKLPHDDSFDRDDSFDIHAPDKDSPSNNKENLEQELSSLRLHAKKAPHKAQEELKKPTPDLNQSFDEVYSRLASSQNGDDSFEHVYAQYASSSHAGKLEHVPKPPASAPSRSRRTSQENRDAMSFLKPTTASLNHAVKPKEKVETSPKPRKASPSSKKSSPDAPKASKHPTKRVVAPPKTTGGASSRRTMDSRMSSTSRELQQLQQERLEREKERKKMWELYEKNKAQRAPTSVQKRSTKKLTVPVSPRFQSEQRTRRTETDKTESPDAGRMDAPRYFTREHAPAVKKRVAKDVKLFTFETETRASKRPRVDPRSPDKLPPSPDYANMKLTITKGHSPRLMTSSRHRPVPQVEDTDASELQHKFRYHSPDRRAYRRKTKRQMRTDHQLIVAKTPKLKGIERHRQYVQSFQERLKKEEEEDKNRRRFRALPRAQKKARRVLVKKVST